MPFATQVIQLLSFSKEIDIDSALHTKCVLMFWWTVFLLICQTTRRSFDHLRDVSMVFPFFLHKKVQHCKRHGVLNKNADPECSGCISVRSCRSAAAANTCNFSANAEHLVPRLRPGPLDNVQRSHGELQFTISRPEWNCQSASLAGGGPRSSLRVTTPSWVPLEKLLGEVLSFTDRT